MTTAPVAPPESHQSRKTVLAGLARHPFRTAFAVLAIAIVILILIWDWNWFRKPICRYVTSKTDRACEIAGNLDVDLGRVTRVTADAVRFGNAGWSKRGDMARTDRLQFDFELWPALFRREFRIPELRLAKPRVLLETGPDGVGNWVFGNDDQRRKQPEFRRLWIDDGNLQFIDAAKETDIAVRVASEAPKAGDSGPPIRVAGGGRWQGNRFTLEGRGESPLDLRNPDAPYSIDVRAAAGPTHAHAVGTLLDPLRLRDFDLKLALGGQNMDDLYPLLGIAIPPTPPYRLNGRLTRVVEGTTRSTWKYDEFTGVVGDSDLRGWAHVTTGGKRPHFRADLQSRRLDIDDLAGFIGAAPQTGAGESSNPELAAKAARQARNGKLFPDEPYKLEKIRAMDADVRFRARKIETRKLPIDDMDATLALKDGVLQLKPLNFGVAGGDIRSTIRMDARENVIRTKADIDARNLDLSRLAAMSRLRKTAFGRIGAKAAIASNGNSIAAILGNADGKASLDVGRGQISKLWMEFAGMDLAGILKIKLTGDRQIPINCVYGDFAVEDGMMSARAMAFDTTETTLYATGNVNLRAETLDLTVRPRNKHFSPLSLRTPIYVRGTLLDPDVRPDYKRMGLRAAAAVALGSITAPIAALVATTDLGRHKGSPCATRAPAPAK